MKIINNVVRGATLRNVQSNVLEELSDILVHSFGPNGSNACLKKENAFARYTKDGHSILGSIQYNGIIEQSIKDDIESITRYIVKTVGDGTTSAVLLSNLIFKQIKEIEATGKYRPVEIVKALEKVVESIKAEIKKSATELTLQDVYDIAMISTNGNEFVANTLYKIYEQFGNNAYIDVSPAMGTEMVIKSYDGMTLNSGYNNPCYITNPKTNTCEVPNPELYFFEHPVDTAEMAAYLSSIISQNLINPVNEQNYDDIVPTVIFAPKISQDVSGSMDSLTNYMAQLPAENKLPVCVITEYHEPEQLEDLARMCGAKMIRKYIDPKVYQADVEAGRAPTPATVKKWAGHCERVVAHSEKTNFINPSLLRNADGSYSEIYKNLVNFLKTEIDRSIQEGVDAGTIGRLKRRLHSLECNMVELYVGGLTQTDREALRDLVEDAVLNLRSAGANGVGLAANLSAVRAIVALYNINAAEEDSDDLPEGVEVAGDPLENSLFKAIYLAYKELVLTLYSSEDVGDVPDKFKLIMVNACATEPMVYNIRTKEWATNVKTSIMSDITILDTVARIIGIMATCNQFLVPSAAHNIYEFN